MQRSLPRRPAAIAMLFAAALLAGTLSPARAHAQSKAPALDLAVTFDAERSLKSNTTQNFWLYGGGIELGTNTWRGLGIAANVIGTHAASIGNSGVPISLVTATFGPRYRWHAGHKLSLFGQGMVGEANAFKTLIPALPVAQTSGNGLASQVGGGVDYRLSQHFAARVLEAAWVRTTVPNATDNVQNNLRLGAGLVVKWGR